MISAGFTGKEGFGGGIISVLFKNAEDSDVLDDVGVVGDISSGGETDSVFDSFCSFNFKNRGATSYFLTGTCSGDTRALGGWYTGDGG